MIQNFKRAMSLLFLAHDKKKNIITGCIILVIGIIAEFVVRGENLIGPLFILLFAVYPTQMLMSVSVSNMVLASKDHKSLQVEYPNALYAVFSLPAMVLVILLRVVILKIYPENSVAITNGLALTGILSIFLAAYTAFAFKYYIASLIVFLMIYFGTIAGYTASLFLTETSIVSFPVAIVIAVLGVILGGVINYFSLKVIVNKPISKLSQGPSLRKQM